jgi:hypothetical protein
LYVRYIFKFILVSKILLGLAKEIDNN